MKYGACSCFGALTIDPLQAKLPLREGADVVQVAFGAGVNFVDTTSYMSP